MTGARVIAGLFFDLDGTLVNTYQADFLAYRDAVREVAGLELRQAEYAALHGMEIAKKLLRLAPGLTAEQVEAVRSTKKRRYPQYLHLTKPNEALIRFLAQFANHQHCALVTTAKRDNADSVLGHHELRRFFETVICGDDVARHKPDPEAYLLALQRTGLRPDQVLAFEDSQSGIDSAKAAGITVLPVREFAPV